MAFVNLPANLQDIFGSITDRISKLESGPNQPMVYADSAQTTAISAQTTAISAQSTAISAAAAAAIASAQAVTAQATANTAYLAANVASAQAITAQNTANSASSQATVAQSTASFAQSLSYAASAQATSAQGTAALAQTTADGKNTIYYSLTTPGLTANTAGDVWFQYSGSGLVIGQYVGLGGTSWQQQTITQAVIGTLDAGKITTGTLSAITIDAGTGGTKFNVTAAGYMSAQGAYIKGNITADSGTFNGQVNAGSGYFGSVTNGWQINSGGIAALGSGYISGGAIQGTSFNNGNGTFFVNSTGDMVAQSVYIKGAVLGTSGYFGSVTNGWNINSDGITGIGSGYIAGGAIQGTTVTGGVIQTSASTAVKLVGSTNSLSFMNAGNYVGHILNLSSSGILMHLGATASSTAGSAYPYQYLGSNSIYLSSISGTSISLGNGTIGYTAATLHDFYGKVTANDNMDVSGSVTFGTSNTFQYLSSSGVLRSAFTWGNSITTSTPRSMQINSVGNFGTTASTRRKKHEIENYAINSASLLQLPVRKFKYLPELDADQNIIHGFIAEEAQDLGLNELIQFDSEGIPDYFAYEKLPIFLLQLAQEQDKRLKLLEGK